MLLNILTSSEEWTSLTPHHAAYGYSEAALAAILRSLREKGYVHVEPCALDDRKKLLFGTEKGRQIKAFLDQAFSEACNQLYRGFSEPELLELNRMQQKMLCNLAQAGSFGQRGNKNKEANAL